jgi:hypothetical protein
MSNLLNGADISAEAPDDDGGAEPFQRGNRNTVDQDIVTRGYPGATGEICHRMGSIYQ